MAINTHPERKSLVEVVPEKKNIYFGLVKFKSGREKGTLMISKNKVITNYLHLN